MLLVDDIFAHATSKIRLKLSGAISQADLKLILVKDSVAEAIDFLKEKKVL